LAATLYLFGALALVYPWIYSVRSKVKVDLTKLEEQKQDVTISKYQSTSKQNFARQWCNPSFATFA